MPLVAPPRPLQAKHDKRELVKVIREEGVRLRRLGSILVAWREVALRSGPGRREALRALRESRQVVYAWLGDELMSGDRDWVAFLAGVALLTVLTPSPAGSCPRVRVPGVLSGSMHVGCRSLEGSGTAG